MSQQITVSVTRQENYRLIVDFGETMANLIADEPPPLGQDAGPSPSQLLSAAVANCLSASLLFAFGKYKEDPGQIVTVAEATIDRNDQNRLRVTQIKARLTLGVAPDSLGHLDRALAQFEDFCTVSQSVRAGVPLTISVFGPDGTQLK